MQVNAETGIGVSAEEIQIGIDGWKKTYNVAWSMLEWYQACVLRLGYVESPWGRRRYFESTDSKVEIAANQREAANFPIQSTVADTMAIAFDRIVRAREQRKLTFRLMNQVHDAVMALVPVNEIDAAKEIVAEGMGGVAIPMPSGKPLYLDTDVDVSERWSPV